MQGLIAVADCSDSLMYQSSISLSPSILNLGTVLSKDENEDEMAEILRDKEYLNEQYDVLFSRYNALELDLDDLRNEKDKETIKLAKYEEVIKQYESDMEILKSQVLHKPYF